MAAGDPGVLQRNYSAIAVETTLTASISASSQGASGTIIVGSVAGFPSTVPYTLVLDPDTSREEVITVTATSGTTLTVTRGQDNTQAVAHSAGVSVRHAVSARDFREEKTHAAARGYDADQTIMDLAGQTHVHGIVTGEGVVVGTLKTQTLTNKTLTTPTVNGATITGTVTSTATITGGTITSATVTSSTISGGTFTGSITATGAELQNVTLAGTPVITGLSSAGMIASSATPKSYVDNILGSSTSAAISAASAAASATAAATSATSAAASATTAANSASAAATSATSAAASATAAATSATSAAASATSAATSATSAAASATTASNSAATAVTQAANAAASATAAATSAASAAASATAAATSATSAAASATAAAAAATSAIQLSTVTTKGDLIVGTGSATVSRLSAGSNGYILSADNTQTTGLAWIAANPGDITSVTAGTGLSGGGTSGDVTVSLNTSSVYVIPSQTGNSGKYLTTDGTTSSWGTVNALPSQTGNSGKYLTTDGSTASWATVTTDPTADIFMMMGA